MPRNIFFCPTIGCGGWGGGLPLRRCQGGRNPSPSDVRVCGDLRAAPRVNCGGRGGRRLNVFTLKNKCPGNALRSMLKNKKVSPGRHTRRPSVPRLPRSPRTSKWGSKNVACRVSVPPHRKTRGVAGNRKLFVRTTLLRRTRPYLPPRREGNSAPISF